MDARAFAAWAHGDQKYGDDPYIVHLDEVVAILRDFGHEDDEHVAAGFLHDVLEDSGMVRYDDLGATTPAVRRAVMFCTDSDGTNRKERKAATYQRMRGEVNQWLAHAREPEMFPDPMTWIPMAIRVKLADRLANTRHCIATDNKGLLSMYRKESFAFRDALYTPGVADPMWAEYDRLMK